MSTLAPRFPRGAVVVRREVLQGRLWLETPVVVVADDGDVLAVLLEPGAPFSFHEHPFGAHPWSGLREWGGSTVLMLHRVGDAYSVWKFFTDGVFTHWYVNFETPVVRHDGAFDTDDHGLDLIVHPDGRSEWKDVDHLDQMIVSARMTPDQVVGVLHAAAGVSALLREDRRWWTPYDEWTPASFVRPVPPAPGPGPGLLSGDPVATAPVAAPAPRGPAATGDLPRLLGLPDGRRDVGREVATLIRAQDFAGAEGLLSGHLAAYPGPIAAACFAIGPDDTEVLGWDELNAELMRLGGLGHRISAIELDLSNYADGDTDAWFDKEPVVELGVYTDEEFPFSTATRQELVDACAAYPAPWTGRTLRNELVLLGVRGLRALNGALLLHQDEHPWSPIAQRVLDAESVAEFLGWWWLHLRFHQAVQGHLDADGLALAIPVLTGSHDVGAWLQSAYLVDKVADHAASTERILGEHASSGRAACDTHTEETVADLVRLRDEVKGWGVFSRDKRKAAEEYLDAKVAVVCRAADLPPPGRSVAKLRDAEFEQLMAAYRATRRH